MAGPSAAHPANSPDEPVEEVDRLGNVVGLVSRAQMRAEGLRHRSVFIAVTSEKGQLLVHRRADSKDVWPGWWDVAVGGVCAPGETWDAAAARELAEELGIEGTVTTFLAAGAYENSDVRLVAHVYECRTDGPFRFADGEITEAHWVAPEELADWLDVKQFLPDSLALVLPRLRGFCHLPT
ncbi:MAG: NUDIX domain-containing protein [Acidimicrobiales bacterium]